MNDDDYDPEIESIFDYFSRKTDRPDGIQKDRVPALAVQIGPATGYTLQTAMQELLEVQQQAVSVDGFIFSLRSLASRLEQEADRLAARGTINFHVCYVLQ